VLSRLAQAGLPDREAAGTGAYLLSVLCALVGSVPTAPATPSEAERLRRKHSHLAELPAGAFPSVQRMAPELVACSDSEEFLQRGLDRLLLGVRELADAQQRAGCR